MNALLWYTDSMQTETTSGAFSGQSVLRAFKEVRPEIPVGTVPIAISGLTSLKAPFFPSELTVPRLATPRGPARARARANMQSLS